MHSFKEIVAPIDDKAHFLFSCESSKVIRLRYDDLSMSNLGDLMQCENVGNVAWFVHECMEKGRVENNNVKTV
jgi:hypothetical protein